jgi:hypothetical protein
MVVHPKTNASYSCYQLNKVRKIASYVKDYEWDSDISDGVWTGKYNKIHNNERIMINSHVERVVYLCNYILKNYYRKKDMNLVGKYTMKRVKEIHGEWWKNERKSSLNSGQDVQVIINGHRYNLS